MALPLHTKPALKERLFFLVMQERATDENKDALAIKARNAVAKILKTGKIKADDLNALHLSGVYLLGLLSPLSNVTAHKMREAIEQNGYYKIEPQKVEQAILNSQWFYNF